MIANNIQMNAISQHKTAVMGSFAQMDQKMDKMTIFTTASTPLHHQKPHLLHNANKKTKNANVFHLSKSAAHHFPVHPTTNVKLEMLKLKDICNVKKKDMSVPIPHPILIAVKDSYALWALVFLLLFSRWMNLLIIPLFNEKSNSIKM